MTIQLKYCEKRFNRFNTQIICNNVVSWLRQSTTPIEGRSRDMLSTYSNYISMLIVLTNERAPRASRWDTTRQASDDTHHRSHWRQSLLGRVGHGPPTFWLLWATPVSGPPTFLGDVNYFFLYIAIIYHW